MLVIVIVCSVRIVFSVCVAREICDRRDERPKVRDQRTGVLPGIAFVCIVVSVCPG